MLRKYFDDNKSILKQLEVNYTTAAILLHPFIQAKDKRCNSSDNCYPDLEEILSETKRYYWTNFIENQIMLSKEEIEVALKTINGSYNKRYKREDLSSRLIKNLPSNLFLPTTDQISEYILIDIISYLKQEKKEQLLYTDPLTEENGVIDLSNIELKKIYNLFRSEMIIEDIDNDFLLMSVYDSHYSILLSNEKKIEELLEAINVEHIKCDQLTTINWYEQIT